MKQMKINLGYNQAKDFKAMVNKYFNRMVKSVDIKIDESWIENDGSHVIVIVKLEKHLNNISHEVFFSMGQTWFSYQQELTQNEFKAIGIL